MAMRLLDLFSGIGGFSYAAEKLIGGYETVAFCEMDDFCQKVLKKHWPQVPIFDDVRTLDATRLGRIDICTFGFPCQPVSQAGVQKGDSDDRWLWDEIIRILQVSKPKWIIAENVKGLITIQDGFLLEHCISSLENEGYEIQPIIIPACAKNAPHRRDRVWIIGQLTTNTNNSGNRASTSYVDKEQQTIEQGWKEQSLFEPGRHDETMAYSSSLRGQNISRNNKKSATRSAKNENVKFGNSCTSDRTSEIVADTDSNGHERRWSETRNQDTTGQNTQGEWSANTKDIKRQSNDELDNGEPRVDGDLSGSSDRGTTISTDTTGVCKLSENTDNHQGIGIKDKNKENNDRTLVSQGQKGLQLSEHRGLAADQTISKNNSIRSGDDNDSIERMENKRSDVTDTESEGLAHSNEREICISKQSGLDSNEKGNRGEIWSKSTRRNKLSTENVANTKFKSSNSITDSRSNSEIEEKRQKTRTTHGSSSEQDVSNSNSDRSETRLSGQIKGQKRNTEKPINTNNRQRGWETSNDRATQLRMGDLVNGISKGLLEHFDREPEDIPRVTSGEKDRSKKLRALGNSIVPQVAAEILLAIRVSEESD